MIDTFGSYVWEPALVKANAITAATEAACLVLSVDETVLCPPALNPKPPCIRGLWADAVRHRARGPLFLTLPHSCQFRVSLHEVLWMTIVWPGCVQAGQRARQSCESGRRTGPAGDQSEVGRGRGGAGRQRRHGRPRRHDGRPRWGARPRQGTRHAAVDLRGHMLHVPGPLLQLYGDHHQQAGVAAKLCCKHQIHVSCDCVSDSTPCVQLARLLHTQLGSLYRHTYPAGSSLYLYGLALSY